MSVVQIYDFVHFFSSKFINLLMLEGKAHHFLSREIHENMNYTVQLFWAHRFCILIFVVVSSHTCVSGYFL